MNKNKNTWRYWINESGDGFGGRYYEFKSFKVYWAYRRSVAEHLSNIGVTRPSSYGSGYVGVIFPSLVNSYL